MTYEYLVKLNNQHKKNLEAFLVNNEYCDKDNVKKGNTYHLFCENKNIF